MILIIASLVQYDTPKTIFSIMTTCTTSIVTDELEVRYGKTVAVTAVNLEVPEGSLLSVIGPNGAGKSALLKALAGTIDVYSGSVKINGPTPSFVMQSTDVDSHLPVSYTHLTLPTTPYV